MIKYGIFAPSSADIRFDFPLSTSAHRSVNSFAHKDFTIRDERCEMKRFFPSARLTGVPFPFRQSFITALKNKKLKVAVVVFVVAFNIYSTRGIVVN